MCKHGLNGHGDVHESWELSCPESSFTLQGRTTDPMRGKSCHSQQPCHCAALIASENDTPKLIRLQASNNHYIPEENSMAFVFPET